MIMPVEEGGREGELMLRCMKKEGRKGGREGGRKGSYREN